MHQIPPTINPYESPVDSTRVDEGIHALRMKYLNHERGVQSISVLLYAGAGVLILLILLIAREIGDNTLTRIAICLCAAVTAAACFVVGRGLQKLRPWTRIVGTILTLPSLLGFPFGTAIGLYILYLLLSSKGKFVFSEQYARIRAETPHLDPKRGTSPLALLILAIVGLVAIAVIIVVTLVYIAASNPV